MNIQDDILDKLDNLTIEKMKRIHFIADLHHSHKKIVDICKRPVTYEEHDEWLVNDVFNKYIGKKDEVYVIGDVSFANKERAQKFVARLNGNKHLIIGNHDKSTRNLGNWQSISQIKDFTFSQDGLNIHIVLCHFPIISYNRQIHGSWHLFGHCHCRPPEYQPTLSFDVGIDRIGFARPFNLYEICKIMSMKQQGYNEEIILKSL